MHVLVYVALVTLCTIPLGTTGRLLRGRSKREMEPYIVGGAFAKIEEFSHSAFLAISCKRRRKVEHCSCGSSILNQRILLTASHCFDDCNPNSEVLVGVGVEKKRTNMLYVASHFMTHPKYDTVKVANDIALIAVNKDIKFNNKVKRVILIQNPPKNEIFTLAGWGITDEEKMIDTLYLKFAKQVLISREECERVLDRLNKGTICVKGIENNKDYGYAAQGDSGSAIVARGYIQVGLVSFKVPMVSKSIIAITDVGYFYKWILTNAQALFCRIKN